MTETLLNQQEAKHDQSSRSQRQNSQLKRTAGIILSLVMIALSVYVLNLQNQNSNVLYRSTDMALTASDRATANYRTYVGRYKETKIELDETTRKLEAVNHQLDQVSAQLATTRDMLSQTKGMLLSAQEENAGLKQELRGLDTLRHTENVGNIGELQDKIRSLRDKDAQVSLELARLKSQLRAFQAGFSNPEEGRSLIVLFQNKIKLVKSHMRYLKQEAFFTKIAAQREKDRLAALNGNSGFLVRNGQARRPNGTKKSFAIDVKIVQ